MEEKKYEYNNPNHFVEKIKPELDKRGVKIKKINSGEGFGSWTIEFGMDSSYCQFVWDGKNKWLIFDVLGLNKKHPEDWTEIDLYKCNLRARTVKELMVLEKYVIENMLASLDKLKQKS